ncbi:MAG: hypothetical protein GF353_14460 [Candidatus Lokiarchaeota archaeon]|nr:hypothetical protein [Candidatus Lokiarchaeota archaeon]
MKKALIKSITDDFESYSNHTKGYIEFWFAKDLQHLSGYTEWRNFNKVINKAKTACETSGHKIPDHFVDVNKTNAGYTLLKVMLGVNVPAISKHLKNIYEERELDSNATVSKMETVQQEGGRENTRLMEF